MSDLNYLSCAYQIFVTSYTSTTITEKRVFKKNLPKLTLSNNRILYLESPHPSSPNIVAKRFVNCLFLESVRARDQKPYLCYETKGRFCIKIEFNPQKKISLLQYGGRFFVYSSNVAAVTSSKHMLFACFQY